MQNWFQMMRGEGLQKMDGDGSTPSDKKMQLLHSAMNKYLGEDEGYDSNDADEDQFPEYPQNVRAFSLRTGRDNFDSNAWNPPTPTSPLMQQHTTNDMTNTQAAGSWVGFIPSQNSFLGANGGDKEDSIRQPPLKNKFSQQPISTVLNVLISSSILKEAPTQLDLKRVSSEFGNSFSGACSVADLKAYIVSLSTDARNVQSMTRRQGNQGWGEYEAENDLIESLTEDELIIVPLSKKRSPMYDHEVLFDPAKVYSVLSLITVFFFFNSHLFIFWCL